MTIPLRVILFALGEAGPPTLLARWFGLPLPRPVEQDILPEGLTDDCMDVTHSPN